MTQLLLVVKRGKQLFVHCERCNLLMRPVGDPPRPCSTSFRFFFIFYYFRHRSRRAKRKIKPS
jgi:hypothetical protein